jgi:hypothetical protein
MLHVCLYLHRIKAISAFILKLGVPRNTRVRSVAACVRVMRAAQRQVLQLLKTQMSETNHLHHVPLHLRPTTVTESQERCRRTVSSGFSSEEFEPEILRVDDVDKTVPMLNNTTT